MFYLRDCVLSFRHFQKMIVAFGRGHPKKVEAIGLFVVLLSVFIQLQADRYQREIADFELKELKGEIILTRQKAMGLVKCQSAGNCQANDHDWIKTESNSFIRLDTPERHEFWHFFRYLAFIVGSALILIGKWLDGPPIGFSSAIPLGTDSPTPKEQLEDDV